MIREKKTRKHQKQTADGTSPQPAFKTNVGELWIDPDLNRKMSGPGGNRGEHTTPTAELLKLADLALRKSSQ